jgi:choline dehydrogenase-like flavoprotein
MLIDFRAGQLPEQLDADLCIVGAGAAGIAMAREFGGQRQSVIVLESGGLAFDEQVQDLYAGVNAREDFSLSTSRFRMFGGTTSVWGGWCAPLDELDFERRDWVADSGWPIARSDLRDCYARAQQVCQLGRFRYAVREWPNLAAGALALDPAKLAHRLWQLSPPARFGALYRDELDRARNVRVVLNASATEIVTGENGAAARYVQIASLDGRRAQVRAKAYVLACGGIEIPRLLLVSRRFAPAGLGNDRDLVGRYFMEHPHPDAGGVLLSGDPASFRAYADTRVGNERVVLGFGPSAAAQRRLRILNSSIAVNGPLHHEPSEAWDSLMKLLRAMGSRHWPKDTGTLVGDVLRDLDDVLREGYLRATDAPVRGFSFTARTETAPLASNRITLEEERDALGMHRVRLHWRPGSLERVTVERTMQLLAEEIGRLDVGRVRINELLMEDDARWSENLSWFGHHLGTTRMSSGPASGVVDADCRIHGVRNVYVASGSVFPTSGFANPTLTIVALALRLADHLKARIL